MSYPTLPDPEAGVYPKACRIQGPRTIVDTWGPVPQSDDSNVTRLPTVPSDISTTFNTMRQTHTYTSDHYRRDNGFPLAWMFRCCLSRSMTGTDEEAEEHFQQRNDARQGKIIGRPAAYVGKSSTRMTTVSDGQKNQDQKSSETPAKQTEQSQPSVVEQRELNQADRL